MAIWLDEFFRRGVDCVCLAGDGRQRIDAPPPAVLVAGAFNPIHPGHWGLAAAGARLVGAPPAFELCVVNIDKPALEPDDVARRLRQFAWRAPLWVTRAPTFAAKARLFPGTAFAVGADTAIRILNPRYYEQGETGMAGAMTLLRQLGCRFLVACRVDAGGTCIGLEELAMPPDYRDLFAAIPRTEFRLDISSTALRQRDPV